MNKEQIEDLAMTIRAQPGRIIENTILEWFEQNPSKSVVVCKQQDELQEKYDGLYEDYQSLLVDKALLESKCGSLSDALLEIEMDTQSFQPNWDDAPEWANWLAQDLSGGWNWYETKPLCNFGKNWRADGCEFAAVKIKHDWKTTLQQRPKPPSPYVEVGQVWEYIGTEIYITPTRFTVTDVSNNCIECEQNPSFMLWKGSLSDFLAKFERVQYE